MTEAYDTGSTPSSSEPGTTTRATGDCCHMEAKGGGWMNDHEGEQPGRSQIEYQEKRPGHLTRRERKRSSRLSGDGQARHSTLLESP